MRICFKDHSSVKDFFLKNRILCVHGSVLSIIGTCWKSWDKMNFIIINVFLTGKYHFWELLTACFFNFQWGWWWWLIIFSEWLTDERRLHLYCIFQPGPLSEILTITNLRHAASRIWTCTESEFRLCWMKLCSSNNHYTKALRSSLHQLKV